MKENKYDNPEFFEQYSKMARSVGGLAEAGEWYAFRTLFPELKNKRVLDLGCGFGWHCQYAAEQGASLVVGTDISQKMLEQANEKNRFSNVTYQQLAIEDLSFPENSFDVVISSLAFHYIESFVDVCTKVSSCLVSGGDFVFSVEHPIFTAQGQQDWHYSEQNKVLHWPVDQYFSEGKRQSRFLGKEVSKYHKSLTTYIQTLLQKGFQLTGLIEPQPDPQLLKKYPEYQDELRRPMFLLVSAQKK
ncbi:class I SAM-dependent methyltransferase [Neisseria sp. Ec49-e6-T10]|uniref:class I SAM-dependent methyltransferase n=1 Tax=Neisseria sp. Ec49-e6-T10 TaxID=3140744 RepID=UPI003EBBA44F